MAKKAHDAPESAATTAPMFHDYDLSGVTYSSNAHPETEYEHRSRLKHVYPHLAIKSADEDVSDLHMQHCGISSQAKGQTLTQVGQRVGTMSFNSVLAPSKRGGGPEVDVEGAD